MSAKNLLQKVLPKKRKPYQTHQLGKGSVINPQKTDKLLKDLKEEVAQLEQSAATAQRRQEIASVQADELENRNKLVLQGIEDEATIKRNHLLATFDKEATTLQKQLDALTQAKSALQEEVIEINKQKVSLSTEASELSDVKLLLNSEIDSTRNQLSNMETELQLATDQKDKFQATADDLEKLITQLRASRTTSEEDINVLQAEVSRLEDETIELDSTFKNRKTVYDSQLQDIQLKLKQALDSLQEAQKQDKMIREDIASKQLALDKRETVVRRMEARVSDAESRIEELQRYDTL